MTIALKNFHERKIRVAVIGVGYLGKFHAEKYARMEDVDLVGIADTDVKQGKNIADRLNTHFLADHRELLGMVDAVSIAVPTPLHFAIARDFLGADTDVMIEKPITADLDQADILIDMADRRNCIIQVGHLERFNPALRAIEGLIDHPWLIESHRLNTFKERGTDVSVVLDLMIHDIDIVLNLVKTPIRRIDAAGRAMLSQHDDLANARLEFADGCVANMTAGRIAADSARQIRLFQKNAVVTVDFAGRSITIVRLERNNSNATIPALKIHQESFDQSDPLDDELRSFVMAVRRRSQPQVTGAMGRAALRIALEIMEKIKNGVPNQPV